MKSENPLRYFDTLLRKNRLLNVQSYHQNDGENGISIFQEIIASSIYKEGAKTITFLKDDFYSSDNEAQQKYFVKKISSQLNFLSSVCGDRMETCLMLIKDVGLVEDKLIEYINLEHVYNVLREIKDELLFSWNYLTADEPLLQECCKIDFPMSSPRPIRMDNDAMYMEMLGEITIEGIKHSNIKPPMCRDMELSKRLKVNLEKEISTNVKPLKLNIGLEKFAAIIGRLRAMKIFNNNKDEIGAAFASILLNSEGNIAAPTTFIVNTGINSKEQFEYLDDEFVPLLIDSVEALKK